MDFTTFQTELRRVAGTVQAFAAVGAALRLQHAGRQAGRQADPAVQARLVAAVEAVLPGALDGLNPQQISDALAYVTQQIGRRRICSITLTVLPGGFFRTPTHYRALAVPLARTSAVLSRSPPTVPLWLRRSPAAFSMSAPALAAWRWRRRSYARRCAW